MNKAKQIIILLNLILLLFFVNSWVVREEKKGANREIILFELAPADPRSLMQGDYMRLNYKINNQISESKSYLDKEYAVIITDQTNRAQLKRIQDKKRPLYEYEMVLKYKIVKYQRVSIGGDSYFFQEGKAEIYEKAKYGGFKIDVDGNTRLMALYDENLKKIE